MTYVSCCLPTSLSKSIEIISPEKNVSFTLIEYRGLSYVLVVEIYAAQFYVFNTFIYLYHKGGFVIQIDKSVNGKSSVKLGTWESDQLLKKLE